MIIKQLILKEGTDKSNDTFSAKRNLIFSTSNTKGKTTYLRLLFFSLGYPIPAMKGIDFNRIETTVVFLEKNVEYTVERNRNFLQLYVRNEMLSFTLPSEHEAFLSYIFQYDNLKVINNLLGFLYIDQDKGWSLLNRGTVIGKIKFNIEEFLAGLNHTDITVLLEKRRTLEFNKKKYSALLNIQELSEQVYERNGEIFVSDIEKELMERVSLINLKIENAKETLREINSILRQEKQFFDYIDSMRLFVRSPDGEIPVTRDTLVNASESTEFLKARRNIVVTDIEKMKREKAAIELKISEYNLKNDQTSLFSQEDSIRTIDKKFAFFSSLNQDVVANLLEQTEDDLKDVKGTIRDTVKKQNRYISLIYKYVLDYAKRLNIESVIVQKEDFIFTSDLKSISGATLQKMVFAFKLAFLKVTEEAMGTKLFLVIDSPKSKELDDENVALIMRLVEEELSDNQVFIASIYNFDCEKKLVVSSKAIEVRE